jgi:hypothetical protein
MQKTRTKRKFYRTETTNWHLPLRVRKRGAGLLDKNGLNQVPAIRREAQ